MNGISLYAKYAAEFNRNRDSKTIAAAPFWNDLPKWKQEAWNAFASGLDFGQEQNSQSSSVDEQSVSDAIAAAVPTETFHFDDASNWVVQIGTMSSPPVPTTFSLSAPLPIQKD